MKETPLLNSAEARIREHRMGDMELIVQTANGKPLRGARVTIEQTRHEFLFGSNIFKLGGFKDPALDRRYLERFVALLNYATLPFYWDFYEPNAGKPNAAQLERMVRQAREAGLTVKGHPLVWHEAACKWWPADTVAFETLAEARVRREVGHFAGSVDRWDVVNEAVVAPRFENAEGRWMKELGPAEAVTRALGWARAVNPKAQLLVNDFVVDDQFAALLREIRRRGGTFDAIGLQSHMHKGTWPLGHAWGVCEQFKEFGVPLHFTELTVLSGPLKTDDDWRKRREDWHSTAEGEQTQADYVEKLYTLLFSHPSVAAITWWDFSDRGAWQGAPAGLLRVDLSPKPAYERLLKLIKGKWWTAITATSDEDGRVVFRGFLGEYRAVVKWPDGTSVERTFSLRRGQPTRIMIQR